MCVFNDTREEIGTIADNIKENCNHWNKWL